jgi:hypothetical protein
MTAFAMRRNEIRLAADLLARAEAWVDQAAPELQVDIARIRAQLLVRADRLMDRPVAGVRPTIDGRPLTLHVVGKGLTSSGST